MKLPLRKFLFLIWSVIFLAACSGQPGPSTAQASLTPMPTITEAVTDTQGPTMVIPTPVTHPTATADTRLPPEDWQQWPVIPTVTPHAIEVYRRGLAMGLDPHAFSKVGDCQSVKAAFMGYLDLGNYPDSLKVNYPNLQETIDYFKGHFNTDGQAVRGGFNAAAVLSPLWADPHVCLPGENPLDCELRTNRPIIVIVRMEIWWDGRTTAQYEVLMRRILDDIIAHGAVPILATKADNVEGDNSINLTTAKLAYEYDLPLWNFWASVQDMPAHGMETKPPHNDGFHISTNAWSVQSFTALQALDSVWRGLAAAGPNAQAATPSPAATATSGGLSIPAHTPAPTSTPTHGPTPLGSSDRIVFGVAGRQGETVQYRGVYWIDPTSWQTGQLFGQNVQFQSASRDGKYILVSEGTSLYRANVDGAMPLQLTDSLYPLGDRSAIWLADGRIAALLTGHSGSPEIAILSAGGSVADWLPGAQVAPMELYASVDENHIYWESGSCSGPGVCTRTGPWVTGVDGMLNGPLAGIQGPSISPDGNTLAYNYLVSTTQSDLGLASPAGTDPQQIGLPGKLLTAYAWSPAGDRLAVVMADVSDYSGLSSGNRNLIIDPHSRVTEEFPRSDLLNSQVLWSPDGRYLFWLGSLATDTGYKIAAELVNRTTKQVIDLSDAVGQTDPNYLLVTNAAWLPRP